MSLRLPPTRCVYKLVQPGVEGVTRRLSFDSQPTWNILASRVHELYFIPVDDVGLIYVDGYVFLVPFLPS